MLAYFQALPRRSTFPQLGPPRRSAAPPPPPPAWPSHKWQRAVPMPSSRARSALQSRSARYPALSILHPTVSTNAMIVPPGVPEWPGDVVRVADGARSSAGKGRRWVVYLRTPRSLSASVGWSFAWVWGWGWSLVTRFNYFCNRIMQSTTEITKNYQICL